MLKIKQPRLHIKIDRAHRNGTRSAGKVQPMVAKFALSEYKTIIKSALSQVDPRTAINGVFKVNDQFPAEVPELGKELIPRLISEIKKEDNKATLARNKLYVNKKTGRIGAKRRA